jgi:glycosyltransferase involved in cell wall biosynthesis
VGALSREQVRDWMRWTDAFVLASRHESFGMVVGESLACDTPVIATRCGGPEYIVTDDVSLLVEPEDAEGLAHAMATAVDGGLRPAPGVARSVAVGRFGPEAFLASVERIYASLS